MNGPDARWRWRAAGRASLSTSLLVLWCSVTAMVCAAMAADANPVDAGEVFADADVAALARAVARGDAPQVRALAGRVDLTATGNRGVTLTQWAVLKESDAGLRALLEAGADPAQPGIDGTTAIHTAAMANDASYLDTLLRHGIDPDTPDARTGATPLMAALTGERTRQFEQLMAAGADPDARDSMGNTALHLAAKIHEHGHILDLLEAGADPTLRNAQGVTFQRYLAMTPDAALSDDARRGREDVRQWLRDRGIPIEAGDKPRTDG